MQKCECLQFNHGAIYSLQHRVLSNHFDTAVYLWFVLPLEDFSLQSRLSSQLIRKVSAVFLSAADVTGHY